MAPTKTEPPLDDDTNSDRGRTPRWIATVWYRSNDVGLVNVEHLFEELFELHDLIENGPNFHAIERVEIRHTTPIPGITLESDRPEWSK